MHCATICLSLTLQMILTQHMHSRVATLKPIQIIPNPVSNPLKLWQVVTSPNLGVSLPWANSEGSLRLWHQKQNVDVTRLNRAVEIQRSKTISKKCKERNAPHSELMTPTIGSGYVRVKNGASRVSLCKNFKRDRPHWPMLFQIALEYTLLKGK